ncbi:hypothetical protein K435DRAFT_861603 [Dendrothele bispora CBS 962.96]|uniref:Uncharacterized protein n=1 Tax=Dendrothele bispora (strain CBS 962.96) TaxID=1314807 RepID=A0A4S8LUS4_DENBC|nr:hypothetical protein K435DRAFT_861603 [Dendrothele bispora CBS 962.96]
MHHITLNISESTDSLAEKNIASTLQDLVNGTITPDFAAHTIESVVVSECQEAYKSYTNSTQEQLANGTIEEPSPSGWSKYLWDCMGHFNGHGLKSEHTVAYLNFSAFLACLLAHGIAEVTRLSALIRPSPFGARGPSYMIKQFDSATALHQYEGYASAAAQWILYAGNALYEMWLQCHLNTILNDTLNLNVTFMLLK